MTMKVSKVKPTLQVRGMVNALHTLHAVNLGVQMGFFKILAKCAKPIPILTFVEQTACSHDYVVPWVRAMQSAGVLDVSAVDAICLSPEWQEALTDLASSNYIANLPECHLAIADTYRQFPALFRSGAQLPQENFSERLIRGISRDSIRFANVFVTAVLKRSPELRTKLETGATVYDVGCGGGTMTLDLSRRFPKSTFIGIDILPRAIAIAKAEARTMGVVDNAEFSVMNATQLPPDVADCVILNEVWHEVAAHERPAAIRAVREAIKPGGVLFVADVLVPESPVEYAHRDYLPAALCGFFEAPWGSRIPTRAEFIELLLQAGFGEPEYLPFDDTVFAAFVMPR